MRQGIVVGVKGQGDESLEPAGLILQRAQTQQMFNPLFDCLDGAVEHGAIRAQPHLVGRAVHIQPFLCVALVRADALAYTGREDLGAAPGQRIQPGRAQAP